MKDAGPGGPTGHPGYLRKRTRVKAFDPARIEVLQLPDFR